MQRYHRTLLPQTDRYSQQPTEPESQSSRRKRRRKNVRIACNACRVKKCGCDGLRPICSQCVERGTRCEYITAHLDDTPNMALKRKIEDLQQELHVQTELLNQLKSLPEQEAFRILQTLRSRSTAAAGPSSLQYAHTPSTSQESDDEDDEGDEDDDNEPTTMDASESEMDFMPHNHFDHAHALPYGTALTSMNPLSKYPTNHYFDPNHDTLSHQNALMFSSLNPSTYTGTHDSYTWPHNVPFHIRDDTQTYPPFTRPM